MLDWKHKRAVDARVGQQASDSVDFALNHLFDSFALGNDCFMTAVMGNHEFPSRVSSDNRYLKQMVPTNGSKQGQTESEAC